MDNKYSKLWEMISENKTPGTTPVSSKFWRLLGKNSKILEVGSGWGRIVFECTKRGHSVTGIDVNPNEVRNLQEIIKQSNLDGRVSILNKDILKNGLPTNSFDGIIMQGLLSAIPKESRKKALDQVYRVLKGGGFVHFAEFGIMTDPDSQKRYNEDFKITKEFGTMSVKDSSGQEIYRTHNFDESELRDLISKSNLNIVMFEKRKFKSYHGNIKSGMLVIAQK